LFNTLYPLPPTPVPESPTKRTHFAFFGRLEQRKGLVVFLQAFELLAPKLLGLGIVLSFIGPEAKLNGKRSTLALKRFAQRYPMYKVNIVTNMTTAPALDYIKRNNAVAVIPSLGDNSPYVVLETLAAGISIITTTEGGAKELLSAESKQGPFMTEAGSAPDLSRAIQTAIVQGIAPFQLRVPFLTVRDQYLDLFEAVRSHAQRHPPRTVPSSNASVLIGVTSHDRPNTLLQTLRSLLYQDYNNDLLGVVVVDDASQTPAMAGVLKYAEKELARSSLRMTQVLRHASNMFVAQSRNEIITMAEQHHFDWVCFMVCSY
jgi:hypothetical protein